MNFFLLFIFIIQGRSNSASNNYFHPPSTITHNPYLITLFKLHMDGKSKVTLRNWEKISTEHQKLYKNFLAKADKKEVLKVIPELHEQAFEKIDCLHCARCCKRYSPRFKRPDIKRISKALQTEGKCFH